MNSFMTLAQVESSHIREVLKHTNGNKMQAAKILGIDASTLYRKLQRNDKLKAVAVNTGTRKPRGKATPKKLARLTSARREEVDQYIEDIYYSLKVPS